MISTQVHAQYSVDLCIFEPYSVVIFKQIASTTSRIKKQSHKVPANVSTNISFVICTLLCLYTSMYLQITVLNNNNQGSSHTYLLFKTGASIVIPSGNLFGGCGAHIATSNWLTLNKSSKLSVKFKTNQTVLYSNSSAFHCMSWYILTLSSQFW